MDFPPIKKLTMYQESETVATDHTTLIAMDITDKDNIILADFIGERLERVILPGEGQQWQLPMCDGYYPSASHLEFDKRWERLMPVWYKFRDLKFNDLGDELSHDYFCDNLRYTISEAGPSPSEACKLLAEGIRWYNSINQTVKK